MCPNVVRVNGFVYRYALSCGQIIDCAKIKRDIMEDVADGVDRDGMQFQSLTRLFPFRMSWIHR